VRTHIPVQGSLPSEFAISGMAREEQRRLDTEEDGPEPLEEEKGNRSTDDAETCGRDPGADNS